MIRLDVATVLLQWATGGLLFTWVTTRRRQVGIGYGWLLRSTFLVMAVGALVAGRLGPTVLLRDVAAAGSAVAVGAALAVSILRRRAGVTGERERRERGAERVAAMTGRSEGGPTPIAADDAGSPGAADGSSAGAGAREPATRATSTGPEFPPALDLVAPVIGALGLVAAVFAAGGPVAVALVRTLLGAAFLGAVTDAMLLGHWYLVQPGLSRAPIVELTRWVGALWPFEVAALLVPPGMVSVFSGAVDDGYGGLLGWFWAACAVTTGGLVVVTLAALKERGYSAVMAATGLLYLAILTAFGTDLVARALLSG